MTALVWDQTGERTYETGVDAGVLYMPDQSGAYTNGVAWNGLTSINETPSGAEANPQYADNIKYLELRSAEDFGATIEALTYPKEFLTFDGAAVPTAGVTFGQQPRGTFGLSYRTLLGNDVLGNAYGYKLHLLYGCTASPSERAYTTVNDSPEAVPFSWEVTTVPVTVSGYTPTALVTIDANEVDLAKLLDLQLILYGDVGVDPRLPSPAEVVSILDSGVTVVTSLTDPTEVGNVITITEDSGVVWHANGMNVTLDGDGSTDIVMIEDTLIEAVPAPFHTFAPGLDTSWAFTYV